MKWLVWQVTHFPVLVQFAATEAAGVGFIGF
jgi:hypothetical protein